MKKMIFKLALFITSIGLGMAEQGQGEGSKFEQDRKAILSMAGTYKVDFNFEETYSLKPGYEVKEKKYHETAHEVVLVAEDTGNRIVLQHVLQVHYKGKERVIKHWSQVWTYQDKVILNYQGGTSWKGEKRTAEEVAGTWSQLVTQVDDSPRYESCGKWQHTGNVSQWVSAETARPLPRREYTKRDDYDILMARNTHIVSPEGWVHEQSNKKLVKRDGKEHFLALERGFNSYTKDADFKADAAKAEWEETKPYWKSVRHFWLTKSDTLESLTYRKTMEDGTSMRKTMRKLMEKAKKDTSLSVDQVEQALKKFIVM